MPDDFSDLGFEEESEPAIPLEGQEDFSDLGFEDETPEQSQEVPYNRKAFLSRQAGFKPEEPSSLGQEAAALGGLVARAALPTVGALLPLTDAEKRTRDAIGQAGLNVATLGISNTLANKAGVNLQDTEQNQLPLAQGVGNLIGNVPGFIGGKTLLTGLAQAFPKAAAKVAGVASLLPKTTVSLTSGLAAGGQAAVMGANEELQRQEEVDFQKALKQGLKDAQVPFAVGLALPGLGAGVVQVAKGVGSLAKSGAGKIQAFSNYVKAPDAHIMRTALRPTFKAGKSGDFDNAVKEGWGEIYRNNPRADLDADGGAMKGFWESSKETLSKVGQEMNQLRKQANIPDIEGVGAANAARQAIASKKFITEPQADKDAVEAMALQYEGLKFDPEFLQDEVTKLNYQLSPFYNMTKQGQGKAMTDAEMAAKIAIRDHLSNELDKMYSQVGGPRGEQLRAIYGSVKKLRDAAERRVHLMAQQTLPELRANFQDIGSTGDLILTMMATAGDMKTVGALTGARAVTRAAFSKLQKDVMDSNKQISRLYERMRGKVPVDGKIVPPAIPNPNRPRSAGEIKPQVLPSSINRPTYDDLIKQSMFYKEPPPTQYPIRHDPSQYTGPNLGTVMMGGDKPIPIDPAQYYY